VNPQPQPQSPALVQVRAADALIAVVPYLLGFHPQDSLVVLAISRSDSRVRLAFRFDLPDPPDRAITAQIVRHAAVLLTRNKFADAVIIGYGPGTLVTPLADLARQALPAAGIELHDVLRVDDGRCWSYICTDPSCCPAEGVPVGSATHPAAAVLAGAGIAAASSRDALAATISRLTGPEGDAMAEATALAERAACQLAVSGPRTLLADGLAAVQHAITMYQSGGSLSTPGEFARLAVALTSLRIRDDAWARMDPAHQADHLRLWTDLTRRARPGYIAPPASLLAFTAWQAGDGALANLALDRALADQPDYSMALLLRDALTACLPPTAARLPMTPEEVAASYDDRRPLP
jgi:hypothetical protein